MIQVSARGARTASYWQAPIAMLQVTDLAIHSRVGVDEAAVWVTDVSGGEGTPGATVTLFSPEGERLAQGVTDAEGVLILRGLGETCDDCSKGYLSAELNGDRAVISLDDNEYDLSPWAFGAYRSWGVRREAVAASVFTERGIYRPGEPVYAKAIVRDGTLGQLRAAAGDSLRWVFYDRDGGVLEDSVVVLSRFGTADHSIQLPDDGSLGSYRIEAQLLRRGTWTTYSSAYYRVAEYRPPEFLVDAVADGGPRFAGDSVGAVVSGRYLFGAPMKECTCRGRPEGSRSPPGRCDFPASRAGKSVPRTGGGKTPTRILSAPWLHRRILSMPTAGWNWPSRRRRPRTAARTVSARSPP